jgi:hypothetical protein
LRAASGSGCAGTTKLAGVVELSPLGDVQIRPALPEELKDLVHAARADQAEADGDIEGVLARPDGLTVAAALEVDWSPQVHLLELAGGPGLRAGVLPAGQQRGEADPGRGQAIALQDALDGPPAGERTDAQGLQLGTDGRGPDQTVAGGRRGMGLEPAAAGADGPLQFGWDPLRVLVADRHPVVEALGSGLHSGR